LILLLVTIFQFFKLLYDFTFTFFFFKISFFQNMISSLDFIFNVLLK